MFRFFQSLNGTKSRTFSSVKNNFRKFNTNSYNFRFIKNPRVIIRYSGLTLGTAAAWKQAQPDMNKQRSVREDYPQTRTLPIFPVEYDEDNNRIFSLEEIHLHSDEGVGIWVTFQGNVYDITKFVDVHRGGNIRLQIAAGKDLSFYFNKYKMHYRWHIQDMLKKMYIGKMKKDEIEQQMIFTEKNFKGQWVPLQVWDPENPGQIPDTYQVPSE